MDLYAQDIMPDPGSIVKPLATLTSPGTVPVAAHPLS